MGVQQVTERLVKITKFGMMNCYLVQEEDGFTVVDTGIAGMEKMIVRAADERGRPIKRVALTHAHADHAGGLDALLALLPEVEVIASAQSARFMAGDFGLEPGQAEAPLKGGFPAVKTRATQTVGDGDAIGSLRIVATPGHTPGHVAFLDERDGTLIAGDAFQTLGGVAVAGVVRWLFPMPALATWHRRTAAQSAERLLALKPSRLAVGHGKVLENPVEAMRRAVAVAQR